MTPFRAPSRLRESLFSRVVLGGLALLALLAACTDGTEQASYPSKAIVFVSHSTPGGGGDMFLRELTKYLQATVPVPMVVENRSGGGSAMAVSYVATRRPDGYYLYGTTPTMLVTPIISRTRYSYEDLEPVANLFTDPMILYVKSESPWRTLDDVVSAARKRPGQIRWGVAAPGSVEHIIAFDFQELTGIKVQPVTYEGGGDLMVAILGGHVDIGSGEFGELLPLFTAGQLRPLVSFTAEPLEGAQLPTAREQGVDVVVEKFRGIMGPKGLDPTVIRFWEDAIQKVLEEPAFRTRYEQLYLSPAYMGHEAFGLYLDRQEQALRSYMRELGIVP